MVLNMNRPPSSAWVGICAMSLIMAVAALIVVPTCTTSIAFSAVEATVGTSGNYARIEDRRRRVVDISKALSTLNRQRLESYDEETTNIDNNNRHGGKSSSHVFRHLDDEEEETNADDSEETEVAAITIFVNIFVEFINALLGNVTCDLRPLLSSIPLLGMTDCVCSPAQLRTAIEEQENSGGSATAKPLHSISICMGDIIPIENEISVDDSNIEIRCEMGYMNVLSVVKQEQEEKGCGIVSTGNSRIFVGSPTHLSLVGITLQNGTDINGGAILQTGGYISITNTTFRNNKSLQNGGAIHVMNSDGDDDAAVTTLDIIGSRFVENAALLDGGAISTQDNTEVLMANRTIFLANVAIRDGGAIAMFESTSAIANTMFIGNSAKEHGGAVYVENSKVALLPGTAFDGNMMYVDGTPPAESQAIDRTLQQASDLFILDDIDPASSDGTEVSCIPNNADDNGHISFCDGPTSIYDIGMYDNTNCKVTGKFNCGVIDDQNHNNNAVATVATTEEAIGDAFALVDISTSSSDGTVVRIPQSSTDPSRNSTAAQAQEQEEESSDDDDGLAILWIILLILLLLLLCLILFCINYKVECTNNNSKHDGESAAFKIEQGTDDDDDDVLGIKPFDPHTDLESDDDDDKNSTTLKVFATESYAGDIDDDDDDDANVDHAPSRSHQSTGGRQITMDVKKCKSSICQGCGKGDCQENHVTFIPTGGLKIT